MSYVSERIDTFTEDYPSGEMDRIIERILGMCQDCESYDDDEFDDEEFEDEE